MARFDIDARDLVLDFTPLERLGGLRRGARVALADVDSVEVVDDPWTIADGIRVGTGIPWVVLLGTMLRWRKNDVIAIYGRKPAVVVNLRDGARWQRLIATVPEAEAVAESIASALH